MGSALSQRPPPPSARRSNAPMRIRVHRARAGWRRMHRRGSRARRHTCGSSYLALIRPAPIRHRSCSHSKTKNSIFILHARLALRGAVGADLARAAGVGQHMSRFRRRTEANRAPGRPNHAAMAGNIRGLLHASGQAAKAGAAQANILQWRAPATRNARPHARASAQGASMRVRSGRGLGQGVGVWPQSSWSKLLLLAARRRSWGDHARLHS